MTFPIAEIVTSYVIEERLKYLAEHPDHINWMLSPFVMNQGLSNLVDAKYVSKCIDYLIHNRPMVRPVYELDMNKMPSIVVASYQGESQQFVGDEGYSILAEQYDPRTLLTFDATSYIGNTLVTTNNQRVLETVWPGLYVKMGDFSSQVTQVIDKDAYVWLALKDEIPSGVTLKGCKVDTSIDQKWYKIHSSIDMVKISVTLTTAGDHSIHRLMTVMLRYCLKSGRLMFEANGLQTPTYSQRPAQLVDNEQLIWQTEFTIEAKATDHWIDEESGLVTAPMIVNITPPDAETEDWV